MRFNPAEPDVFAATGSDRGIALFDLRSNTPIRKLIMQTKTNAIAWNPMEAFNFTGTRGWGGGGLASWRSGKKRRGVRCSELCQPLTILDSRFDAADCCDLPLRPAAPSLPQPPARTATCTHTTCAAWPPPPACTRTLSAPSWTLTTRPPAGSLWRGPTTARVRPVAEAAEAAEAAACMIVHLRLDGLFIE